MNLRDIVDGAVGAFPDNCAGYLNPGASGLGYIAALKLSVAKVKADMDVGLEGIVSYDRCEADDAYIGQINMLTASSFCGVNGAVWGYDLARAEDLTEESANQAAAPRRRRGSGLFRAAASRRRLPAVREQGAAPLQSLAWCHGGLRQQELDHAAAARQDPQVWCAIALAIAEDRGAAANLFIEDASDTATTRPQMLDHWCITSPSRSCAAAPTRGFSIGKSSWAISRSISTKRRSDAPSPARLTSPWPGRPFRRASRRGRSST